MKKLLLIVVALATVVVATEAKPKNTEANFRVGSYNVWSHSARQWVIKKNPAIEPRNWENSKKAVAELIVKLDCDILGMQEVTSVCRDDLEKLVKKAGGKKYKLWWVNTYPEGHKSVVGNAVFYNKKMFKFDKQTIYYLSPTPTEISKGWDEKRHYRASLAAEVTHKKSGKKFLLLATHGPLKKVANANAAKVLVDIDKNFNPVGLPTIVVGDMNARPGKEFHTTMCEHFEDAFLVAKKKCGTIGTFNSAGELEKNFTIENRRIDHIYVHSTDKGKCIVKEYKVNRDKYKIAGEPHYPSDHNPIYIDLTIK